MRVRIAHRKSYHAWPGSTPLMDVVRVLVAAASVMVAGYALIFMALAVRDGNGSLAARYGLFLAGILVINGLVEVLRRWRRHHC